MKYYTDFSFVILFTFWERKNVLIIIWLIIICDKTFVQVETGLFIIIKQ